MKKQYLCLIFSLILISCDFNSNQNGSNLSESVDGDYNSLTQIAIDTNFEPTLELTDEIKNTSLKDLIKQEKGNYSTYDQWRIKEHRRKNKELLKQKKIKQTKELREQGYTEKEIKNIIDNPFFNLGLPELSFTENDILHDYELKYVPESSNLAKVYYLENMGDFIRHNSSYYEKIIGEKNEEEAAGEGYSKQEKQKNWKNYL